MKKKLFSGLILLTSIMLLAPVSAVYADTGVGNGSSGAGTGGANNGGYWQTESPSGSCKTNKLQKYFANGQKWRPTSWNYNATVTNGHYVDRSIGPVHYTYNGQNYSSGNASVSYSWLITKELGPWSWRSKVQIGGSIGQIWIDALSGNGAGHGQLIWACASGSSVTTTTVDNGSNTKTCIVGIQNRVDSGAPAYAVNNTTASNSSIYNNCLQNYDLTVNSPGLNDNGINNAASYNKPYNLQARQITKDVTQTSVTTTVKIHGTVVATNTANSYSSAAAVTQPWESKTVQPTNISLTPSDLGYWFVDNREVGGGHWVDSSGNPIPESNPQKHSVKLAIGELWDNNKPVRADWTSLSAANRTYKECQSSITIPGQATVNNPSDLVCAMDATPMTLSSQKIVNGRSIHLLSFAPVNNQSAEDLTWIVTTSGGANNVTESRVIRSINSDPLTVNLSSTVQMSQPFKYGGYVNFNFATNGGVSSSAAEPIYNTPWSAVQRGSAVTKIMGGDIWTYTANNDVN